jgi:hypothetical protein
LETSATDKPAAITKPAAAASAIKTTIAYSGGPIPSSVTSGNVAELSGNKRASPGQKKRPYRRTKRPKNYNDKSTVTTTSPAVHTPVNVYDAVLGEAEDLLRASMEAQSLGRLKMASAYQLLLHARLVGLGKRFDRTTIAPRNSRRNQDDSGDEEESADEESVDGNTHGTAMTPATMKSESNATQVTNTTTPATVAATPANATTAAAATPATTDSSSAPAGLPNVLAQLTEILPSNLEMDTSMMEHLARAAVELHHQRTGRKKSADGLLASPMTGMIGEETAAGGPNKIAWSEQEQGVVAAALDNKQTPMQIARMLKTKTEAQVKAYLKNQSSRKKGTAEMEEEMVLETPRKRGGRGRKPPTTAMNTVPNANLDARSLLQGKISSGKP